MLIVDHRDMESLSTKELHRLLRWCAEEVIRREGGADGMYTLVDEVSEALYITGAKYAIEIRELES